MENKFEGHIKTVLTGLITALILWIGLTVQEASSSIAILKNEVAGLKVTIQESNRVNYLVIQHTEEIKTLNYRIGKLEGMTK